MFSHGINKELEKLNNVLKTKKIPFLGSPQLKVTTIFGGIKVNINLNYCKIETDRRMILGENTRTLHNFFLKLSKNSKKKELCAYAENHAFVVWEFLEVTL